VVERGEERSYQLLHVKLSGSMAEPYLSLAHVEYTVEEPCAYLEANRGL
jgi:hypothetical protein